MASSTRTRASAPNGNKPATRRKVGDVSSAAVSGIELTEQLGSAELVKIEEIIVDPAYQRTLRHDLVNDIARHYDIVKAGPILVSERTNGKLYAVDGQHRMAGALQAGEELIFAHVVHGLSRQEEAELRLARNDRRSDTTFEKFRTRLVMHDPKAEAVVEILRQQGTQLNLQPNLAIGFNCLAAVEQVYDIDGTGVWLGRAVRFLKEAYATDHPLGGESASVAMLKSAVWFIDRHIDTREADWNEMTGRLGKAGPGDIRRKAVSHKAANGGAAWVNTYRAMVEIWNFGRRDTNKLAWKTAGSISQIGDDYTSAQYVRDKQRDRNRRR